MIRNHITNFFFSFFQSKKNIYLISNKKKKYFFFDKTQNHDLFISPKRKKAVLKMSIKSSVMSELDHQMSVSLIDFASPLLNPTSKFDLLKN